MQRGKDDKVERLEKQVEYYEYKEVLAQKAAILTKLLLLAAADVHRREFNEYTDLAGKPILEIGINLAKLKLILLIIVLKCSTKSMRMENKLEILSK